MSEPGSSFPFNVLPKELQQEVLTQSLKQLDQKHRLGVVPRVCSVWRDVALDACDSLEARLQEWEPGNESWVLWMARHGSKLRSLTVKPRYVGLGCSPRRIQCLNPALLHAAHLQHLTLRNLAVEPQLTHLTNLSSLCFDSCCRDDHVSLSDLAATQQQAIRELTQLQSLEVRGQPGSWNLQLDDVWDTCSCLPQLTSLTLGSLALKSDSNGYSHLATLPPITTLRRLDWDPHPEPARPDVLSQLQEFPFTKIAISVSAVAAAAEVPQVAAYLRATAGKLECIWFYDREGEAESLSGPLLEELVKAVSEAGPQLQNLVFKGINPVHCLTPLTALQGLQDLGFFTRFK